ncbi:MAG: hypothetical protein HOH36_17885 [Acidimicrobiaceae bacterium]|nr:hypothetical protein [Acidimicrobiaceae bacterium]MBT5852303.1 hypothetical protein [Acidimicrobiaceae bacterium]
MNIKALFVATAFLAASCGGGSGGSLAEEAEQHADATCGCSDFDCTKDHVAWFNRMSITEEDQLDELSDADRAAYEASSLRAGDCQNDLR